MREPMHAEGEYNASVRAGHALIAVIQSASACLSAVNQSVLPHAIATQRMSARDRESVAAFCQPCRGLYLVRKPCI